MAEAGRRPRRRGTALACRWRWDPACVFLVARPRPRPSPGAFPRARAPSVEARAPRSPLPPVLPRPGRRLAAPPTGRDRNGPRRAGVASGHRGRWWPRAKCSRLRLGGARAPGARRGTPAPCAGEPWPWRWVVGPSPRELRAGRRGQSPFRALRDRPWCWRPLAVRPRVCSGGRLASGGSVFPPSPRARLSAGRGPSSTATASPAPRPSPPSAFSRALPRRRLFWLPDRGPAPSATRFPGPLRPPPCPPPLPARRRRCVRAGDRPPRRPVLARAGRVPGSRRDRPPARRATPGGGGSGLGPALGPRGRARAARPAGVDATAWCPGPAHAPSIGAAARGAPAPPRRRARVLVGRGRAAGSVRPRPAPAPRGAAAAAASVRAPRPGTHGPCRERSPPPPPPPRRVCARACAASPRLPRAPTWLILPVAYACLKD